MAPILRINGKLDPFYDDSRACYSWIALLLFNIEGDVQSRLRNLPATTGPALGLEALIAVHVGADLRFAS